MENAITATYGLTHLAIAVNDIEATLRFYQSIFDMQVMYHEDEMLQLATPGCHDILVFGKRTDESTGKSGGIAHFGFRLRNAEDMSHMEEKIIKAGAVIKEKGEFVPGSPYIFFYDPDGYEIEVWYEFIA
jgi:catechol 2,3-dioxygenase-like lactoylglutathione lyase family enzyme